MEFDDILRRRRSIRAFAARDVDREELQAILEAARGAPSAGNLQAYELVVVRRDDLRQALMRAALGQEMLRQAPVVLAFFANPERSSRRYGNRGQRLYCIQDATIACCFAMLKAEDLGLASVWIGAFEDRAVSAALSAPEQLLPVALLPVGWPAERPAERPRRSMQDLVRHETFGGGRP